MTKLDLVLLERGCTTDGAAIRILTKLHPVGGLSDKIFPPTYAGAKHAVYAVEKRIIDGREIVTVLLDSVQSQANRLEEALLLAIEEGLRIPILEVHFDSPFEGRQRVTSLDAPHRIADALIRDSLIIGKENESVEFLKSSIGKGFAKSSYANATVLFQYCPTALIFGVWDSHGSGGGLGTKFARALVSEIVGFDAVEGVRTGGRLDPFNIGSKLEEKIYKAKDPDSKWTFDPGEAELDKQGKPVPAGKGDVKKAGKPAAIGHGNIPPALVAEDKSGEIYSGGVTISSALQTTVLSFPQLRRLRFPEETDKSKLAERNKAGRVVLATLALHAVALQKSDGYLLRSRSQLVPAPEEPGRIEYIDANGVATQIDPASLSIEATRQLLDSAVEKATAAGLEWESEPVRMKPSEKLLKILVFSHASRGDEENEPRQNQDA